MDRPEASPWRPRRRAVLAGLVGAPLTAVAQSMRPPISDLPTLTVFAAASLKDALDKASWLFVAQFTQPVRLSYGASSALARQIEQGAPADVFISADLDWMDYLDQRHLIKPGSRRKLFSNHLALIAPANSKAELDMGWKMPLAKALKGGRLAVAGPEVPAGRYAQQSLTRLGIWDQVKDHLAPAENVRAALAFVGRGEVPFGIVYDTDAKLDRSVRIVALFPDETHKPIVYPGAVVANSKHSAAQGYLSNLVEPMEAAVFRSFGFRVL